ncbi:hypothetical protein LCGC14_2938420, partial [marine sediment metagenome]
PSAETFLIQKAEAYELGIRQTSGNNEVFGRLLDGTLSLLDETANNNDGTGIGGGPTADLTPQLGTAAADFDGIDQGVDVGSDASIDNIWDGGGSVEFWIDLVNDTDSTAVVTEKFEWDIAVRDVNGAGGGCGANLQGVRLSIDFSGTDGLWRTTSCILDTTTGFQHIAITYNSDAVGNNPTIFLNGVSQGVTGVSTPVGTRVSDDTRVGRIGRPGGAGLGLEAQLDEVRLWTDTSGDGSDRNTECTGAEANLQACYRFNLGGAEVSTQDSDADTGGTQAFVTGTSYDIEVLYHQVNLILDIDGGTDEDTQAGTFAITANANDVTIGTTDLDASIHEARVEEIGLAEDLHANDNDGTIVLVGAFLGELNDMRENNLWSV